MSHSLHRAIGWLTVLPRFILSIAALILCTQTIATPALATGVYEMPQVSPGDREWVVDEADLLSRLTENKLSNAFSNLKQETGIEVRFVTFHRLNYGETVESFAEKLFDRWFPTPEEKADRAILVLDNVTNNAALYAGDHVDAELSDAIADSIVGETLMVPIRNGNQYNQAFKNTSDRLVAVLSGQPDPGPPSVQDDVQTEGTFTSAEETDVNNSTVVVIVLLIVATIIPMATYYIFYQ